MIYPYKCECGATWDVIKSATIIDRQELCKCGYVGERTIAGGTSFYGASDWNNQYYSDAFNCVVRNKQHRAELAKQHGVAEVGNDFVNGASMQKHYDDTLQRKLDARWEKI